MFKFIHPCLFLFLLCYLIPSFNVLSDSCFVLLNFAAVLTVRILIKLVTQHLYVPKWLLTCMDTRGRWTVSRLHGNTHAVRGVLESYTYSAAMLLSFLTVLLLTACAPRTPYTPYRQQRQGIYDFWCGMEKNNSINNSVKNRFKTFGKHRPSYNGVSFLSEGGGKEANQLTHGKYWKEIQSNLS